jgi:hypothetical protein
MRRTLALVLGALAAVWVVAGCGILPTEPVLPPVGVRLDNGVLSVIVPICPNDSVRSASVSRMAAESIPSDAPWSATGFTGDQSRGIALGPQDWSSISGDYSGWTWFGVEVRTDGHSYGGGFEMPEGLGKLQSLPSGSFYVDGKIVKAADYQASVARDFPCPAPTK